MRLDNKVVDLADLKVSHDYLLGQDELLSDRINELGSGIDGIQSQITALGNGSPIPVETVAEMTDNTKAYLYTGSEQGYTSGYWYTYDSTQAKFVPRGEYGAGVIIDSTLTVTGNAADAKATGDAIKAGKTFVVQVPGSASVLSGSITAGDFAKALAAYTAGSGVYAVKDGEVYQLSAVSSSTMTFTQMYHGTMNFIKQIQITSADTFTVTNTALSSSATDTSYSNTASGLTATNVQAAIDENAAAISNTNGRLGNNIISGTESLMPTWEDGYYYSLNSHSTVASGNYSVAIVAVEDGYNTISGHSNCDPNGTLGAEFFDAEGEYISDTAFRNTLTGSYLWDFADVLVPSNAKILKITCRTAYKDTFEIIGAYTRPTIGKMVNDNTAKLDKIDMSLLNGADSTTYTPNVFWTDDEYVKYTNGAISKLNGYSVGTVDVSGATNVSGKANLDPNGTVGAWFYDENGTPIADSGSRPTTSGTYDWSYDIPVPTGAKTFRITNRTAYKNTFTCTITGAIGGYDERINFINNELRSQQSQIDAFNTLLPLASWYGCDNYTVLVGKQQRIYFDQICHVNVPGYFSVICTGATYPEVTYTDDYVEFNFATAKSATLTISFIALDTTVVSSHTVMVEAIAEIVYPTIKMMFIGDSLTQQGTLVKTVKDSIGDAIELVGTRGSIPYKNEGRSSWSALEYCTVGVKKNVVNPFYNPNTAAFDFEYYIQNNQDSVGLTNVNIFLGQNDGYQTSHIQYIKSIIDSIIDYDANIIITVMGMFHLAKNNSGCGQWMQNTYLYSYKAKMWNDALQKELSTYGNNVVFVPQFVNLDTYYDFERNTRNASTANTEQVTYFTNNVHPGESGYIHFADVLLPEINKIFI